MYNRHAIANTTCNKIPSSGIKNANTQQFLDRRPKTTRIRQITMFRKSTVEPLPAKLPCKTNCTQLRLPFLFTLFASSYLNCNRKSSRVCYIVKCKSPSKSEHFRLANEFATVIFRSWSLSFSADSASHIDLILL